jgi:ribosomal-protein-alanine N-acetyltransferase
MIDAFPVIEIERLILRQFTPGDLEHVYRGLSDPDVVRYYGVHFDTLEASEEQLSWFSDLESSGKGLWWAICAKADNTFLGAGNVQPPGKTNQSP